MSFEQRDLHPLINPRSASPTRPPRVTQRERRGKPEQGRSRDSAFLAVGENAGCRIPRSNGLVGTGVVGVDRCFDRPSSNNIKG